MLTIQKIPRVFCGESIEVERPYFGSVKDFGNLGTPTSTLNLEEHSRRD